MFKNSRLIGKKIIVTGAASGIGKASCAALIEQGAEVLACDINEEGLNEAVESILLNFPSASLHSFTCDVSSSQSCQEAVNFAIEKMGAVNVLFNNAGIIKRTDVLNTTEETWDLVMNVNLKSVFLMTKFTVPNMIKHGGGCIINTASGWGINGGPKAITYCASKGGVVLLTKALAVDLGKNGIRVNSLCPGDTETPLLIEVASQLGLPDDHLIKQGAARPLGRIGTVEEIADCAVFLASEESRFMTGTNLVVDGGGLAGSL
ncbi:SDR family NAD(P)-dependent oxidoreductase [Psychromonas sp. Urea-02u-13]|uniref:SDR family NAD(P)-dependent oxidoreductase n=1 Tax=Psychromonas sp. Urea-02u-13 TaxID=2058326 RepID=UPI0018E3C726|nr:SDR family oxidoreductase [Psychromonas sp. Urea-02u-13]